jgi:fimbrial chaperone protein
MRSLFFAVAFFAGLVESGAEAASLRVAPVVLDLKAPQAATSLRIWNDAQRAISVQVRIFRWSQENGRENFVPATDVVVSPPITKLRGGGENTIRVVRTSKTPVRGEESYRVIVDELPDAAGRRSGTVNLVIRHSIPVFFAAPDLKDPQPNWSVTSRSGGYQLNVSNSGDRRLRISDLVLQTARGGEVASQAGLLGYVLGQSTGSWFIPANGGKAGGGTLTISAESDAGPIKVEASVRGR